MSLFSKKMGLSKKLAVWTVLSMLAVSWPAQAQLNPFRGSGFELTAQDVEEIGNAGRELFRDNEAAAVGDSVMWENPESGNKGTITIMDSFTYEDLPCFELKYTFELKKLAEPKTLLDKRCQVPDGQWKAL
ncbi:MAG: hypothetical protein AAF530_15830 [Pseudomonadota bacterium]